MNIALHPETESFIEEQVRAGIFPSREALIEAAVRQMEQTGHEELDEPTIEAINEAESQADRGEGIDLDRLRSTRQQRIGPR